MVSPSRTQAVLCWPGVLNGRMDSLFRTGLLGRVDAVLGRRMARLIRLGSFGRLPSRSAGRCRGYVQLAAQLLRKRGANAFEFLPAELSFVVQLPKASQLLIGRQMLRARTPSPAIDPDNHQGTDQDERHQRQ